MVGVPVRVTFEPTFRFNYDENEVLIVGTKACVQEFMEKNFKEFFKGDEHLDAKFMKLLDAAIAGLQPSDRGSQPATASLPVTLKDDKLIWVHVAVISDVAARHNHPGRPDQVSAAMKQLKPRAGFSRVYAAVERVQDLYAWAPAMARAFPMYHSKLPGNRDLDKNTESGAALAPSTLDDLREVHKEDDAFVVKGADATVAVMFYYPDFDELPQSDSDWRQVNLIAHHTRLAAALVDAPCAEMRTTHVVRRAEEVANVVAATVKKGKVTTKVIAGDDLRDQGFGGIYGVGVAAAEFPPALVILSYVPNEAQDDAKSLCLVGKGIVFDTGGLSLKISGAMCGMKSDCGGSAAVLHAFAATAAAEPEIPVHALLCMAENAIGHAAQKNDDIVYMHSGKTVELNNTDAEGRLVLGDGVHYASKELNPGLIVDIATLTGAQGISTGQKHAALLTTDDRTEKLVLDAAKLSGNLCFPILFAPELLMPEFDSKVADMKNSVKNRGNAQSSCAGLFIHENLDESYTGSWAHIDCAYPAVEGERGTGFGVALLTAVADAISKDRGAYGF